MDDTRIDPIAQRLDMQAASHSPPPIEAVGLNARECGVTVNGRTFSQQQVDFARNHLITNGHPNTYPYLEVALDMLFPRPQS